MIKESIRNMILRKPIKTSYSLYDITKRSSSVIAKPCYTRLWQSHITNIPSPLVGEGKGEGCSLPLSGDL